MLNFANLPGTTITFSGGAFSFSSANGYQFDITSVSGGVGDSVGLDGYISTGPLMVSGGPFTIGPITTMGQEQTASKAISDSTLTCGESKTGFRRRGRGTRSRQILRNC